MLSGFVKKFSFCRTWRQIITCFFVDNDYVEIISVLESGNS